MLRAAKISFAKFYFRRALRIFPAFYVFLVVMGTLWISGIIPQHWPSFIAAATYTFADYSNAQGHFIFHTWSLSIEEQFYLLWPAILIFTKDRRKALRAVIVAIVAMPLIRVALYFAAPTLRGHEAFMPQGWIDTMMIGCALAILEGDPSWEQWCSRFISGWGAGFLAVFGLFVTPYIGSALNGRSAGAFGLFASFSLQALCIGGVLTYAVRHPDSVAGRILNNRFVRHVGVISYSLYLWQQIFTADEIIPFPYGIMCLFVVAELSYWLVEKPCLSLRVQLERYIWKGRGGKREISPQVT